MKVYVFNVYVHKEVVLSLSFDNSMKLWKRFSVTAPDIKFAIKLMNSPYYRKKFEFPAHFRIKFAYEIPTRYTTIMELK